MGQLLSRRGHHRPKSPAPVARAASVSSDAALSCIVCRDAPLAVKFRPCDHTLCCASCASRLTELARTQGRRKARCPLCRAKIVTVVTLDGNSSSESEGSSTPAPGDASAPCAQAAPSLEAAAAEVVTLESLVTTVTEAALAEPTSFTATVAPGVDGRPLQAAVDALAPGESLLLLAGIHHGPITLPAGVRVYGRGDATILGEGTAATVTCASLGASLIGLRIKGTPSGTGLEIAPGANTWVQGCSFLGGNPEITIHQGAEPTLVDITIAHGARGVVAAGGGRLVRCTISGHTGAGVTVLSGGDPFLADCHFVACSKGVVFEPDARGRLFACEIENGYPGVEVGDGATPRLVNCILRGGNIGCLAADGSRPTLAGGIINACGRAGLTIEGPRSVPCVYGMTILGASGGCGVACTRGSRGRLERCAISQGSVGITVESAWPIAIDCVVRGTTNHGITVNERGGGRFECVEVSATGAVAVAIANESDPKFLRCMLRGAAASGVSSYAEARGTFEDCRIQDCKADGAIVRTGAETSFVRCAMSGNRIGARFEDEDTTGARLEDCTLSNNVEYGVLIDNGADPRVIGCKVMANGSFGLAVSHDGKGRFEQCHIAGNVSAQVQAEHGGDPRLTNCIIVGGGGRGVVADLGGRGHFDRCSISRHARESVVSRGNSAVTLTTCTIFNGRGNAVLAETTGRVRLERCTLSGNTGCGVSAMTSGSVHVVGGRIAHNGGTAIYACALEASKGTVTVTGCDVMTAPGGPTGEGTTMLRNSDGVPVKLSCNPSNRRFYCGRTGLYTCGCSDGACGPDNGCQCPACAALSSARGYEPRACYATTAHPTPAAAEGPVVWEVGSAAVLAVGYGALGDAPGGPLQPGATGQAVRVESRAGEILVHIRADAGGTLWWYNSRALAVPGASNAATEVEARAGDGGNLAERQGLLRAAMALYRSLPEGGRVRMAGLRSLEEIEALGNGVDPETLSQLVRVSLEIASGEEGAALMIGIMAMRAALEV